MTQEEQTLFQKLNTAGGATGVAIVLISFSAILILIKMSGLKPIDLAHKVIVFFSKLVAKFINKRETKYHIDVQIGKITEKRASYKLYRFLGDLIIDLKMKDSGITPYELLFIVTSVCTVVTTVICRLLFGSWLITILFLPAVLIGVFCVMYTKANVSHDQRIEDVIEAENIICNNIKQGVLVAVRDSKDVLPKSVRQDFLDFIDNVEQKNYHIKTALMELNTKLGSVADDFIKKCIVFEMEEEHGIVGMFADIVEMNNINMEMRILMKRQFEQVKSEFIMGGGMIVLFLGGVLAIYPDVRHWYFTNLIGHIILVIDVLLFIFEFVYITYLRAKEL